MKRSRVMLGIIVGASAGAMWMGASSAFTQKSPLTSVGHEDLVVEGARRANGWFREPSENQVTGVTASCRTCDQYETKNFKTWSAVMGNRWTDIGGYSVITNAKCFNATVQDSDGIQYQHALRKKCDVGPGGLARAHRGTVEVIKDRFMRAVAATDDSLWFRDGGTIVLRFKANRPSFMLGMSIHALQDSFSEEHAVRDSTWHHMTDLKTYVETLHDARHAEYKYADQHFKFKPGIGSLHFPNEHHGDYPFKTMFSNAYNNLKPSAVAAVAATADLMKAFEAARLAPHEKDRLFAQFEQNWLRLVPSAAANAPQAADPACSSPTGSYGSGASTDATWLTTERERTACLHESGVEPHLAPGNLHATVSDYPKFCWPADTCKEDSFGNFRDAVTRAEHAVGHALSDIGSFFAHVAQAVEDFFAHGAHSYGRCFNESGDFGRRGGDHYMSAAHQKADHFWVDLGDAIDMLNLADRKRAVDAHWAKVKAAIIHEEPTVRNQSCDRVRGWFFKGSSKNNGENNCRAQFDGHVANLARDLDGIYEMHIHRGVPAGPSTSAAIVNHQSPLGAHHATNEQVLQAKHKHDLEACKQRLAGVQFHLATGHETCDQQFRARMQLAGAPLPPPAGETADQKRDRFYHELHACLQNPLVRFHNLGTSEKVCQARYEKEMADNHLRPRAPSDEPGGPNVEK